MASTAIRMWTTSDVEVPDALGVRLDELLAWLDVRSHQLLKRVVDGGDVVDGDLQQHARLRVHGRLPQLLRVHLAQSLHARGLGPFAQLAQRLVAVGIGLAPDDLHVLAGALGNLEQGRLRHVEVALVDHRGKVAEEKGEQQRADVAAVDVGVGHGHDPVIAHLFDVEVVADSRTHGGDQVANLVRREHLVEARLLDVEDLAAQWKDRLRAAIAAALRRAPRGVTLDDVELGQRRVALGAIGQLAGQHARLEQALALHQVAGFARRLARPGRGERLLDDAPAFGRAFLEVLGQTFGDCERDMALDLRVAELALGLALELRLQHLDADHRRQSLTDVLTGQVGIGFLEDPRLARITVEHVGERGAKTGDVASALDRVDGVRERDDVLDEGLVVLKRDLGLCALDLPLDVKRGHVDHRLVAVERAHERHDAALEVEGVGDAQDLVGERDLEPLVQVGHLAQTVLDHLAVELRVREDLGIGPEPHDGARVVRFADRLDRALGHASGVFLVVDLAASVDPHLKALTEEVHRRHANAVEAGGDLVAAAAELAPGVEPGHDQLQSRQPLLLVDVDGDAPAVVIDLDAAVREEGDHDPPRVAGEGLVDRVVDHLVDQVVEAARARRADVHARTPPDMLPALEDLDLLGGVRHVRA